MSTTLARTRDSSGSHWYYVDGRPCYELPKKDGKGMKSTTLADARKLNLLPSVTTILRVLAKPALESWKMEQACLAVMTAPRLPGEELDAFVERVLHTEEQHKQEAAGAADRGTAIHNAVASLVAGNKLGDDEEWALEFAESPYMYMVGQCNKILGTEVILCGEGFAGKTDFIGDCGDYDIIVDWKSSKKLPDKASWPEHVLQLSAYAKAHNMKTGRPVKTANCYISSITAGLYMFFNNPSWEETYEQGFAPLLKYWRYSTQYYPTQ